MHVLSPIGRQIEPAIDTAELPQHPLTIGPLEDLLGGLYGEPPADAREPLELALRNANRALAQVNRILDLARLEAGGMALQAHEGDLARELRDVAALFGPLAVRRGIALDVDVRDGAPAWFDRALLEQAVANLLSNALKFTPSGGHVRLTGGVRRQMVGRIERAHTHEADTRARAGIVTRPRGRQPPIRGAPHGA